MVSLVGNIQGNTMTLTDESLRQYDGQNVTVVVSEDKNHILESQLDALRTRTYSSWGEDAQKYISNLRAADRVF